MLRQSLFITALLLLLAGTARAQQPAAPRTQSPKRHAPTRKVDPLQEAAAEQQRLIERLTQRIEALEQARREDAAAAQAATTTAQSAQHAADEAATAAKAARKSAGDAEFSAAEAKTAEILHEEGTKDQGTRLAAAEGLLKRFRLSGDIRLRFEPMFQNYTPDRYRGRLRVRFGVEGALSESFTGGFYIATGTVNDDPVSTNNTLTQFFTRKPIGLDRGWITYHPLHHKWLQLTGGKFAYTWLRTSATFDPDLNPEGFSEKLSFDLQETGALTNVSFTGLQLFVNEVPGSNGIPFQLGNDSLAYGGQASAQFRLSGRVRTTLAATALNWINADSVIKAITAKTLAGNRNTNATAGAGSGIVYLSQFLYTDYMADTTVTTWSERWPVRLTLDFIDNPRAATDQRHAFWGELFLGQTKNKNDMQFGYAFARIEQDAVMAAFNESEMRAQTNVVQHKLSYLWQAERNTTVSLTTWLGRTLNRDLQNAALPPGLPADQKDPYVKRLQFDVIYKF